jgi:hypothetical protein
MRAKERVTFRRRSIGPPALRNPATQKRRVVRLANDDFRLRALCPQHARHALQRAAGAHARDPIIEPLAGERLEDLGGGGPGVDVRVGFVLELPAQEPAMGLRQFLRLAQHTAALFGGGGQDNLGAHEAQQPPPLDAEILGHDDDERIAFPGADHGQADSGIAAGGLDDRLPRLQLAAALGGFYDAQRQPVLDGAQRIERLQLDEKLHPWRP